MKRTRGVISAYLCFALVILGATAALQMLIRVKGINTVKLPIEAPDGLKFHTLPGQYPGPDDAIAWEQAGTDERLSKEAAEELGTDNYITRWFRRTTEQEGDTEHLLQIHCAYYTGMVDTVPHVPERCMIGGGLTYNGETELVPVPIDMSRLIEDPDADPETETVTLMGRSNERQSRVRLPLGVDNLTLRVTPFRDQAKDRTLVAGYFFIANGRVLASANDVRLYAFDLTADYAYYAKIQFLSPTAESPEQLAELAAELLDELFPEIMLRLPDWIEVERGEYPPDNPARALEAAQG